jgi:hypothetical protein
LLLCQWLV